LSDERSPAHSGAEPRSAPLSRLVLAQAAMELRLSLRRGESLLITAIVPLLLLVFFGSVPLLPTGGGRTVDFLLPGILALAVMSSGMVSLSIATAFERQYGVLKRLGGSPLSRGALLCAKLLAVALIQCGQVLLLMLVAAVMFGWRPAGQPLLAVAALLLGTFAFSSLGLLMAGALRAEATLAAANGLYLVLLLLGDMVFPLAQLPGWLAGLARLLPAAAFAEALRAGLQGGPLPPGDLLVLLTWGLVCSLAAARSFHWE
jgi:ABC-2 type transport system permease protein